MTTKQPPQYFDERACAHCGNPVIRTGRQIRICCSSDCAKERKRLIRSGEIERTCNWCSASLAGMPSAAKFCCSDCRSQSELTYRAEYYASNAEDIRAAASARAADSRAKDPLRRVAADKKYATENRDRLNAKRRTPQSRAKANERFKKRQKESAHWRLHSRMASAVYNALKKRKAGRKWESLVGYTLDDLYGFIERQFLPGMNWNNMGEWHIDHILPRASFHYTTSDCPDFKACWAMTNLRPLWAKDNLIKSAKRTLLI